MISAIALVDLDDTLFQTLRKCPPGIDPARLTPFAYAADGTPISFATPAQAALIAWLEATTHLVAVTGRSSGALFRTDLKFAAAVAAHGGCVIGEDRAPSPDWHAIIGDRLAADRPILDRLVVETEREAARRGIHVRARVVAEQALPLYTVVKHGLFDGNDAELHAVCADIDLPAGWTGHINGNNVAWLPPALGKAHAVEWLLPRLRATHPDLPVIGIGDSFTDAPFMQLCDFAMTPTASQLAGRLFA